MRGTVCIGDAVNLDASLNQGLLGWWLALPEQQRGVMLRDLLLKSHGTLTNGTLCGGAQGRRGGFGSNSYDGTNDCVLIPGNKFDTQSLRFYVSAWIRPTAVGRQTIVSRWEFTTGSYRRWLLEIDASAKLSFRASTNGTDAGAKVVVSTTSIVANAWTHVAGAWTATGASGNDIQVFINGEQNGTMTSFTGIPSDTTRKIAIGIMQPDTVATLPFSGLIDDVRIGLLSGHEVAALIRGVFSASCAGYPEELNWSSSLRGYEINTGGAVTAYPWHYYQQMMAG